MCGGVESGEHRFLWALDSGECKDTTSGGSMAAPHPGAHVDPGTVAHGSLGSSGSEAAPSSEGAQRC